MAIGSLIYGLFYMQYSAELQRGLDSRCRLTTEGLGCVFEELVRLGLAQFR